MPPTNTFRFLNVTETRSEVRMGLIEIIREALKSKKQRKIEELNKKILKLENEIEDNLKNFKDNEQRLKKDLKDAVADHNLIESKYHMAIHNEDRELLIAKDDLRKCRDIVKQQQQEIETLTSEKQALVLKAG